VPASSANIGPGFDSIGLALGIWDECVATVTAVPGLRIDIEGEGAEEVPRDGLNLIHRSMVQAWNELDVQLPAGLHLSCTNAVPHCRGLGSSATSIVAGVVAAQGLSDIATGRAGSGDDGFDSFDHAFTNNLAAALEGHPDNSSASVFGGMTLSWTDDVEPGQIHTVRLLPAHIPHALAARNSGRAGLLVEAVARRPDVLLAATREWLHQEQRRPAFAQSMALVDILRGKGHAAVISGAGPSVLVLTTPGQLEDACAQGDQSVWRVLRPGIPVTGASLEKILA
jgi:homoserine kinase